MSCFSGSFASLPGVRCDRFEKFGGEGGMTAADQFFLSHCHTDHMVGLDELGRYLRRKAKGSRINNKLYCSSISKAFMKDRFKIPEKAIVELMPNQPKTVHVYDKSDHSMYYIKITAFGANHCPGSLMFLYERLNSEGEIIKRILYTGDFRYDSDAPLTELKALHDRLSQPLIIDEMYLDTTFCSEQYESFPTRREAEEKIWEQCDKWIKRNGKYRNKNTRNKHVVLLTLPARYGYERILKYIYERSGFKRPVHVNADKWSEYLCMEELSNCTKPDPNLAQWIHACTVYKKDKKKQNGPLRKTLPCQSGEFEVCQIKPSALFFTKSRMDKLTKAGLDRVMYETQGENYYRICYSCHSSLTELKHFVQHFSPKRIRPCVIPLNSSREEVMNLLDSFLEHDSNSESHSPLPTQTQPFIEFSPVHSSNREGSDDSWIDFSSPDKKNNNQTAPPNLSTESRVAFDEFMEVEESVNNSSDEEGEKENAGEDWIATTNARGCSTGKEAWSNIQIIPGIIQEEVPGPSTDRRPSCTITPTNCGDEQRQSTSTIARRRTFAQSKTEQTYYSMPLHNDLEVVNVPKERRFSMPSNMKLPLIKVTPSSPSPDPDDPDYPEFFQDRLYLEHVALKLDDSVQSKDQNQVQVPSPPPVLNLTLEEPPEPSVITTKEEPEELPAITNEPRRIKRQQSMFPREEEEDPPFKRPRQITESPRKTTLLTKRDKRPLSRKSGHLKRSISLMPKEEDEEEIDSPLNKRRLLAPDSQLLIDDEQEDSARDADKLVSVIETQNLCEEVGGNVELGDSPESERRNLMPDSQPLYDEEEEDIGDDCDADNVMSIVETRDVCEEYGDVIELDEGSASQIPDSQPLFDEEDDKFVGDSDADKVMSDIETQDLCEEEERPCSSTPDIDDLIKQAEQNQCSVDELIQHAEENQCSEEIKRNLRVMAEARKNNIPIE